MTLTAEGRIFIWGRGSFGRLGLGDERDRYSPAEVKLPGEPPLAPPSGLDPRLCTDYYEGHPTVHCIEGSSLHVGSNGWRGGDPSSMWWSTCAESAQGS